MSGAVHSSDRVGARAPEARHFHLCHAMCLSSQQRAETRVLSDTPSVTMDTCKYGFIGGWRLAVGALLFRLSVVRAPAARARARRAVLPGVPRARRGRSVRVVYRPPGVSVAFQFTNRLGFV